MGEEVRFKAYEQHQGELFPVHLSAALDPSDPVFFLDVTSRDHDPAFLIDHDPGPGCRV
jgi:hypothetical protein